MEQFNTPLYFIIKARGVYYERIPLCDSSILQEDICFDQNMLLETKVERKVTVKVSINVNKIFLGVCFCGEGVGQIVQFLGKYLYYLSIVTCYIIVLESNFFLNNFVGSLN